LFLSKTLKQCDTLLMAGGYHRVRAMQDWTVNDQRRRSAQQEFDKREAAIGKGDARLLSNKFVVNQQ
jgi:hypothetical protein